VEESPETWQAAMGRSQAPCGTPLRLCGAFNSGESAGVVQEL
jgi:hypothetical protein